MSDAIEFCNTISVLGREWALKDSPEAESFEGISPAVVSVALSRGFEPERFFNPKIRTEMPDPSTLKGMDRAAGAFCDAVLDSRKIAIYGDYDVDGATSTAMMVRWLTEMGQPPIFYIPDRIAEGYGPNPAAMRKLAEQGVEFILFLDCGTRAHESLDIADELGMGIAIIDHHEPDDREPKGILVNPKQHGEDRALEYLCTAGLVFLFLVAVQREMRARGFFEGERKPIDLMGWLGIVALGTVCDMVPLRHLNRAFVTQGLPRMGDVLGLRELARVNGNPDFNERTCGFVFGPCINAEGRIGDTRSGTLLLATDDPEQAREIASKLFETNKERQDLTKAAQVEAVEIACGRLKDDSTIVISNDEWHPGIVGIVASKVKDAVNKPTVIIGAGGTGSCRSVSGYDIGAAVDAAKAAGLLDKGGGHRMAAGLHVKSDKVEALRELLCERSEGFVHPPLEIDMAIGCGGLTAPLIEAMERLRPFGAENPKPRIVVHGGYVHRVRIMKDVHIKLEMNGRFGAFQAILFNGIGTPLGEALRMTEEKFVDVYGQARVDFYAGKSRPVMLIEDAMIRPEAETVAA